MYLIIKKMFTRKHKLTPINEMPPVELSINTNHNIDEINEKLDYITNKISQEFYKLKPVCKTINEMLETNFNSNFINTNFDEQELIEEQIDTLIFNYNCVKNLSKKGRDIRVYKQLKDKEIENQKRFARNALAHYGINFDKANM
jgi:hypothetical protein